MVFKNRVLRNIFGPKRDEVTKDWRNLHNDKISLSVLLTTYYSAYQIKNEMGGTCSMCWAEGGSNRVLVCQREGKISLGRPRHRWNNHFKSILKKLVQKYVGLIAVAQDSDR
jgi:hypothetical protein